MNSKLREQGKKEEKRRLKEFVENAYRCDPRVIAHKEAQRAERWASAPAHPPVVRSQNPAGSYPGHVRLREVLPCDLSWFQGTTLRL